MLRKHVLACTAALAPLTVGRAMVMSEKAAKSSPPRNSSNTRTSLRRRRGAALKSVKENKNSRIEEGGREKPTVKWIQVERIQGEEK